MVDHKEKVITMEMVIKELPIFVRKLIIVLLVVTTDTWSLKIMEEILRVISLNPRPLSGPFNNNFHHMLANYEPKLTRN